MLKASVPNYSTDILVSDIVVTLKQQVGGPSTKYYAPPSLHYGLESRPNTKFIKYEGVAVSNGGYQFPVFKYASGV